MSLLLYALVPHHLQQIFVPLHQLSPLGVVQMVLADHPFRQGIDIQPVGTQQILHLPHVEQVFGYIRLPQVTSYEHLNLFFSLQDMDILIRQSH